MDYTAFFDWLASDNGFAVHAGVFILLLLGGFGFPIPEDIPVALAGVAASKGIVPIQTIYLVCYVGVIFADLILFFIGRWFGYRLLTAGTKSSFLPALTEARVEKTRAALHNNRLLCIFIGRHIFPVRTATFLSAGALKVPVLEFLIADAIAAFFSVSIIFGIGFYLGENMKPETLSFIVTEGTGVLILITAIGSYIFWQRNKRRVAATQNTLSSCDSE